MGNYVETNGIKLHYLERPGDGPTLLLAPGLAAGAHFYLTLLDHLAPRLHVIAFDLRGRGASDKPDTGYTMADHAADMVGAMDALGIDRVAFGGHSFGGLLTYVMAAYYPERIERGVVIDAPAEVDPDRARTDQADSRSARDDVPLVGRVHHAGQGDALLRGLGVGPGPRGVLPI